MTEPIDLTDSLDQFNLFKIEKGRQFSVEMFIVIYRVILKTKQSIGKYRGAYEYKQSQSTLN